jgi:hypothetical protein
MAFMLLSATLPLPAQDEPTIAKDSIDIMLHSYPHGASRHEKAPDTWSPAIKFRVNGPIAAGSQIRVEFSYPGKKGWLKADCRTAETKQGETWDTNCMGHGYASADRELSTTYAGPVDFAIHVSNELMGTNIVLFKGKMKVTKVPRPSPNYTQLYYVDEDWRVPIAYLYRGQRTLEIQVWFRGRPGEARPHLFYQGKPFATPENCGSANFEPMAYVWWPVSCEFFAGDDTIKELNPGAYQVKVLQDGKLTRTADFTVGPDGSFDNGIASANKLGSDKVIIPVKVLVDHAPWNKLAWKTEAFYGNPLTGFTAPPASRSNP